MFNKTAFEDNPDPNFVEVNHGEKEFIFLHDAAKPVNGQELIPLKYGTIITNVTQKRAHNDFTFKVKDTGQYFWVWYGWAMAENTKENREQIVIVNSARRLYDQTEKLYKDELGKIKHL